MLSCTFLNYLYFCAVLWTCVNNQARAEPFSKQLTTFVEAGHSECVYQPVAQGEKLFVEYQVIDGGHGELDITFALVDPRHAVIIVDEQQEANKHDYIARETGIYGVCFNNMFSSYNRKTVSFLFEVTAIDAERVEQEYWRKEMFKEYHMDLAMTGISGSMTNIHMNMMRSRQLQDLLRTHEARDRNLAEANYSLVNVWSWVQFGSMVGVGLLQVYMLRSIFDTKARLYNFWRKL